MRGAGHDAVRPPITEAACVLGTDVDGAEILRMVGDRSEVERALDLSEDRGISILVRQRNRFAHRITVGVCRIVSLARDIRVEGVARMNVKVAEERAAKRIVIGTGLTRFSPLKGSLGLTRRSRGGGFRAWLSGRVQGK